MKKIKAEEIVAILQKHGTVVTVEQAEKIWEFMYAMAEIALDQVMREQEETLEKTT